MKSWFVNQLDKSLALQALVMVYAKRSLREQRLILLTFMGIMFFVMVTVTVMPLYKDYQQAQKRLIEAKAVYTLLAEKATIMTTLKHSTEQDPDRTATELRTIVNVSLKKANLTPEVISSEGQSQLRIGISKVAYEQVATWLTELSREKVKIKSTQIQAMSPGVVSLNIVLD